MKRFDMEYLNMLSPPDEEFETYVEAWTRYHNATQAIDGHIKHPRTDEEYILFRKAKLAGSQAITDFLLSVGCCRPGPSFSGKQWKKWGDANKEALRRLGRI